MKWSWCSCPLVAALLAVRAAAPTQLPTQFPNNSLLFGGDVMLSRHVGRIARQQQDPAWQFRDLAPLFNRADIAFVNLEAPFNDRGRPVESGMIFKAEPEMIEGLQRAGIDVVSTANNHSRDQGTRGLDYTIDWLLKHGIAPVGSGRNGEAARRGVILERRGIRFGFLAYAYDQANGGVVKDRDRVGEMDQDLMVADVKQMRKSADVVIVSMHAGIEYTPKPNRQQVSFARAAIDAGASVVVGHHPHVVQSVEQYRGGWIFYSLGNLIFDQFQRAETQAGLLAQVTFCGRRIQNCKLLPVAIVNTRPQLDH